MYTVDVANGTAVKEVVHRVMTNRSLSPHIPREFTQRGMLERIGTYFRHQNFCDGEDLARGKHGEPLSLPLWDEQDLITVLPLLVHIAQLLEGCYVNEKVTLDLDGVHSL